MIYSIALQDTHDRSKPAQGIAEARARGPFTVIEVGGFLPMKGVRADAIVDIQEARIDGAHLFQGNISMPYVWEYVLDYVKMHGKFDFCLCSHTLEDISNPKLACERMEQIAKAGYIAVPSRHIELSRGVDGPYRGYQHHRWIFTITRDQKFIGFPKLGFLDHMPELDVLADSSIIDLSFFWKEKIDLQLVNDDFLGPTVAHVTEHYRAGLLHDYFSPKGKGRFENIEQAYRHAMNDPGNINQHVPLLRSYAAKCDHVTEFGVEGAISTMAFLAAQPKHLRSYDIRECPVVNELKPLAGKTEYRFEIGDSLKIAIELTDLLFIDTLHTGDHVYAELNRHHAFVEKWIILHDTVTFGEVGWDGASGLLGGIRRFLAEHREWTIVESRKNNNGLMVLGRSK